MTSKKKRKGGKAGSGKDSGSALRAPVAKKSPLEQRAFWWALAILGLLLAAFFNPLLFGGKTFLPPDQVASIANVPFVEEAFASSGSWFERYPLWTPYLFSGMPSFGSLTVGPYTNPTGLLFSPLPHQVRLVAWYLLLGLMVWLFLRRRGLDTLSALLGGVAYVFATHIIVFIMFGHNTKILTLVYLPVLIMATDALWQRPTLRWALILALAVGNMMLARHLQIAYYTFLATGIYLLLFSFFALRDKWGGLAVVKRWGYWVGGAALGFVGSSILVIPAREYASYSIRGGTEGGATYTFATNWSFHPGEMATFFVPSFMGFGGQTYWGNMFFTDFPHYMGILVVLLAMVTVLRWPRDRLHIYFTVLAVFALLVSFGRNFPVVFNVLFEAFPYFNKFRVPVMILVLFQFSTAIMAAFGLHRILSIRTPEERKRVSRTFWMVGIGTAALVLILGGGLMSGGFDDTISRRLGQGYVGSSLNPAQIPGFVAQVLPEIKEMVRQDTLIVLVILALGMGLIWFHLKGRIPGWVLSGGILLLTVVDLWRVDHRPATYYPQTDKTASFAANSAVRFLQQDPEPYRVLPLAVPGNNQNWYAYHKIQSIMGYHPAKLKIYQDVIDERGSVGIGRLLNQGNLNVLNMLNAKYLITGSEINTGPLQTVHRGDAFVVQNTAVLPRMWFVQRVRVIADSEQHLIALTDPRWNPANEALVFEGVGPIDPAGEGTATVTKYEPREIRATLSASAASFLVVSEVYYKAGWTAELDGNEVPIHRTNYVLRGIEVPAGPHELVLRFDPPSFRTSLYLSAGAYALIALGLIGGLLMPRLRRGPAPEPDAESDA